MYRRRFNSKYGNAKVHSNGMVFDSQKEMHRYAVLSLMEKDGKIQNLQRQVKFVLIPAQHEKSKEVYKSGAKKGMPKPGKLIEREVAYYADFVYSTLNGETVVEDVKGMRTTEYIIKRKLMLYVHGIRISEI